MKTYLYSTVECHLSGRTSDIGVDKYMIAFRWLAQVGGASSCMYLTETTLAAALRPLG